MRIHLESLNFVTSTVYRSLSRLVDFNYMYFEFYFLRIQFATNSIKKTLSVKASNVDLQKKASSS